MISRSADEVLVGRPPPVLGVRCANAHIATIDAHPRLSRAELPQPALHGRFERREILDCLDLDEPLVVVSDRDRGEVRKAPLECERSGAVWCIDEDARIGLRCRHVVHRRPTGSARLG